MSAPAQLTERLRQVGDRLAGTLLAVVQARLAQRWRERGYDVQDAPGGLSIAGLDLKRRRNGSRHALPDPQLIWPGDDP